MPNSTCEPVEALARQPLIREFFGFTLIAHGPGSATMSAEWRPELSHEPGWFQGAVVSAIAEFAGALSAASLAPPQHTTMTLDQTIKFIAPAQGQVVLAAARVLKPGKKVMVSHIDISVRRDGAEHLCATMLQTNYVVPPRG